MKNKKLTQSKENGFALLISLIVVGVVLSVGMSILDLTIKQLKISTNTRDSELSFHAANAGAECGRYWQRQEAGNMELGNDMEDVNCFGSDLLDMAGNVIAGGDVVPDDLFTGVEGDGYVYQYQYQFSWGSNPEDMRCSQINTIIMAPDSEGSPLLIEDISINNVVPGYPDPDAECPNGALCTIMSVRGYNRACKDIANYGTVEREVLVQF